MNNKNINKFLSQGYFIFNIKNKIKLNFLKKIIQKESEKILKKKITLEKIHKYIKPEELNTFKLKIYSAINFLTFSVLQLDPALIFFLYL